MGSACAHHNGDPTKCSESGQPKPKVIPTFPASEKSHWQASDLKENCWDRHLSDVSVLVSVKTRGSHQGAQKHTGFCRGEIKESKLRSPLLPGKEKQNQPNPENLMAKSFSGKSVCFILLGQGEPQHNISLSSSLWSLVTFSCHCFPVFFKARECGDTWGTLILCWQQNRAAP